MIFERIFNVPLCSDDRPKSWIVEEGTKERREGGVGKGGIVSLRILPVKVIEEIVESSSARRKGIQ